MRLLLIAALSAACLAAAVPNGRWDAEMTAGGLKIPFTLFFSGDASALTAAFVNGPARVVSKPGTFANGQIRIAFPSTATLEATLADDQLKGAYRDAKGQSHPFSASAYCTCGSEGEPGPDMKGMWLSAENGWRVKIDRNGDDTWATLSRPAGDLGPLSGRFDGVSFMLHYFDGSNAALLEMEPRKDGQADLVLKTPGEAPQKFRASRAPQIP